MIRAEYRDKQCVVNILVSSFENNRSVRYVIGTGGKRLQRLKRLMEYSFEICFLFGEVFLSDCKKGCALILLPDKKKTTWRSLLLDIQFALNGIGLHHIGNVIARENKIEKIHPAGLIYYLWFIGVESSWQGRGVGSQLLHDLIESAMAQSRIICLETSTMSNIP